MLLLDAAGKERVRLSADPHYAPEAMYWRAVAQYTAFHDHTVLGKVAEELRSKYPSSMWASKAIPWLS